MNKKISPEKSKKPETKQYKNQSQSIQFQAIIKRETALFSSWKETHALIVYLPNAQFSLTIYKKDKRTIDEIINLHLTKISKRCSTIQSKFCFGMEATSGRRYLIAGHNQQTTLAAFQFAYGIKKLMKEKSQLLTASKVIKQDSATILKKQLQFQKQIDTYQDRLRQKKQEEMKLLQSTSYSPLSQPYELQYQREYQKENYKGNQREQQKAGIMEVQREEDYCTVMDEEPIVIQQQQPLHLKFPISQNQLQYLQSDDNFKLLSAFSEGRILSKGKRLIKANLLFKTNLTSQQLLESFFHMQLWNQKLKNYKLANRIDKGIYLVQMEIKKKGIFSYPRVCFMMIASLMHKNQPYLVMRSLEESCFQKQSRKEWINFSLWLKVRGQDNEKLYKFISLCAQVQNDKDFQTVLLLLEQLKYYQTFLLTTSKPPMRVLQWRDEERGQANHLQ